MSVRYFALAFGIVYALIGVLGFIPGLVEDPDADDPEMELDAGYGFLLGLFPINVLHSIVHLAVGVLGIAAYTRYDYARLYARALAVLFGVLAIMGIIPDLDTTFGLIPLFSHDIWLHALTALVAAYFGFIGPAERATVAADTDTRPPTSARY